MPWECSCRYALSTPAGSYCMGTGVKPWFERWFGWNHIAVQFRLVLKVGGLEWFGVWNVYHQTGLVWFWASSPDRYQVELQANIFVLNWGRIFKKKTKKYIHVGSDWLDTKIRLCQIIGLIKFKLRKFWYPTNQTHTYMPLGLLLEDEYSFERIFAL